MSHRELTLEERARRRVNRKLGFYIHATVFVLVNAGLWLLGNVVGAGGPARVLPLWGWGLGLAIHGVVTFFGLAGEGLRQRMVAREISELQKRG